jgi:hypothetical protein
MLDFSGRSNPAANDKRRLEARDSRALRTGLSHASESARIAPGPSSQGPSPSFHPPAPAPDSGSGYCSILGSKRPSDAEANSYGIMRVGAGTLCFDCSKSYDISTCVCKFQGRDIGGTVLDEPVEHESRKEADFVLQGARRVGRHNGGVVCTKAFIRC